MSGERIAELEGVVADAERRSGPGDPATLEARMRLALVYREQERDEDAAAGLWRVVALREAGLGAEHPDTLASWACLPYWYSMQGRRDNQGRILRERIAAGWEQIVAEQERQLGHDEPETQFSRVKLAGAYGDIGRADDERVILERVTESWGRLAGARARDLGPVHPDTVYARECHAYSHRHAGRSDDEVVLTEQIAADHERLLGPDDPRTLRALRTVLILAHALAGRSDEAFAFRARFPVSGDEE